MKNRVCAMVIAVHMFISISCSVMANSPANHHIEDFAGFPSEYSERFYYVREYPYTSLCIIAAAVGGIIYYNRVHVKKKVRQLLHLLQGQEIEEEQK